MRKSLLKAEVLHRLIARQLELFDEGSERTKAFCMSVARLLCQLCCLSKVKFYIPGETVENERHSKKAIERGLLTTLYFVCEKGSDPDLQALVRERVYSLLELGLMRFHTRTLARLAAVQGGYQSDEGVLGSQRAKEEHVEVAGKTVAGTMASTFPLL